MPLYDNRMTPPSGCHLNKNDNRMTCSSGCQFFSNNNRMEVSSDCHKGHLRYEIFLLGCRKNLLGCRKNLSVVYCNSTQWTIYLQKWHICMKLKCSLWTLCYSQLPGLNLSPTIACSSKTNILLLCYIVSSRSSNLALSHETLSTTNTTWKKKIRPKIEDTLMVKNANRNMKKKLSIGIWLRLI